MVEENHGLLKKDFKIKTTMAKKKARKAAKKTKKSTKKAKRGDQAFLAYCITNKWLRGGN